MTNLHLQSQTALRALRCTCRKVSLHSPCVIFITDRTTDNENKHCSAVTDAEVIQMLQEILANQKATLECVARCESLLDVVRIFVVSLLPC